MFVFQKDLFSFACLQFNHCHHLLHIYNFSYYHDILCDNVFAHMAKVNSLSDVDIEIVSELRKSLSSIQRIEMKLIFGISLQGSIPIPLNQTMTN